MRPTALVSQINELLAELTGKGLVANPTSAIQRRCANGRVEVTFPKWKDLAVVRRDRYTHDYNNIARSRAYNAQLVDGAFVQMNYLFAGAELERHRLLFLGPPHPQAAPSANVGTSQHGGPATVVCFDFDGQEHRSGSVAHPKSHLTIGLYAHCRIPVSSPLTPVQFLDFILRHFYRPDPILSSFSGSFADCISQDARRVIHLVVPPDYLMADAG